MSRLIVDLGGLSWGMVIAELNGKPRWDYIDQLCEMGALLCSDDQQVSLRKQAVPSYKAQRKDNESTYQKMVHKLARRWVRDAIVRYGSCVVNGPGLEADDLIALHYTERDIIMTDDKDFLQLTNAKMIDFNMAPWGIERIQRKAKRLPLAQGERFLAYQLASGDAVDNIPRLLFSKDRRTMPWAFEQKSPLRALLSVLPPGLVVDSLNCLLLPTPLITGADPVEEVLRRYPEL